MNIDQETITENTDNNLKEILNFILKKKCLIVLDDVHNIFISGQFSGQYKPEFNNHKNLFNIIIESEHQSHFILISQEKCSEMHCLDEQLYPVKCLELSGLSNTKILLNKNLKDEESYFTLLNLYEGNPAYLKDIAILIRDVFDCHVADFLTEDSLVITKNMQSHLRQLFNRLSPIEQQLVLELSKFEHSVSRKDLKERSDLSSTDFMNGLHSLQE